MSDLFLAWPTLRSPTSALGLQKSKCKRVARPAKRGCLPAAAHEMQREWGDRDRGQVGQHAVVVSRTRLLSISSSHGQSPGVPELF